MDEGRTDITTLSLSMPIRVAQLDARKPLSFDLRPDAALCARIADVLGLEGLRKFRFQGRLSPQGRDDWALRAELGATVVQSCAITLAPVTTRIDEIVTRRFLAEMPEPDGQEIEMPEDDTLEPLGSTIDLSVLALEALALALPDFPRADGAELAPEGAMRSAPAGAADLDDARPNPFAALAGLKGKLRGPDSGDT